MAPTVVRVGMACLLAALACAEVSVWDARVFNLYFYVNTHPDVPTGEQAARAHWASTGIANNLQGCGSFDAKQYLDRYPDLKKQFGNNATAALYHYLNYGWNEGRLGYVEGGFSTRYTVSNAWEADTSRDRIWVSASRRMAAGVDSIVWNSHEFLNAWDHGRELQVAITNGHGECFNPTECGSQDDGRGYGTTSKPQAVYSKQNVIQTSVFPAFWLAPGEPEPNPSSQCTVGINTAKVSNYSITKKVTIGATLNSGKRIKNAIEFAIKISLGSDCPVLQIEGPTGYMNGDFDKFFIFNASTSSLQPVSTDAGEVAEPLVFLSQQNGGEYAMGAIGVAPSSDWTLSNAKFYFSEADYTDTTSKWSLVYRTTNKNESAIVSMTSYICVGDLAMVTECMTELYANVGSR